MVRSLAPSDAPQGEAHTDHTNEQELPWEASLWEDAASATSGYTGCVRSALALCDSALPQPYATTRAVSGSQGKRK
jgi:hypothetical protein